MRNNRPVTDLKWNTKKRLKSAKSKLEETAAQWGDVDFFIMSRIEGILNDIDEIITEVDGVDVKSH